MIANKCDQNYTSVFYLQYLYNMIKCLSKFSSFFLRLQAFFHFLQHYDTRFTRHLSEQPDRNISSKVCPHYHYH